MQTALVLTTRGLRRCAFVVLSRRRADRATRHLPRANNYQLVIGRILSLLAVLGLGLACLGIYGVIARCTVQRTGEFGIRLTLGAQAGDITRLVPASGATLGLIASAIGVLGAFGVTRLIMAAFPVPA